MTYLSAIADYVPTAPDTPPVLEPRSPEDVLRLLALDPPPSEYSVDAF